MQVNIAHLLHEHGNAPQKQLYARVLHDGAEALRGSDNTHGKLNAAKLDNIQVNF